LRPDIYGLPKSWAWPGISKIVITKRFLPKSVILARNHPLIKWLKIASSQHLSWSPLKVTLLVMTVKDEFSYSLFCLVTFQSKSSSFSIKSDNVFSSKQELLTLRRVDYFINTCMT
jgi:hypothetical protein